MNDSQTISEVKKFSATEFLQQYHQDNFIQIFISRIAEHSKGCIQFKNLSGSLDAIMAAIAYEKLKGSHLFILHDREEAAYFYSDLQSLLPQKEILFFPTSYRKPYQFLEVENANILQRAETLNKISQKSADGELIVSYPEALTEKVINQKSLISNTFIVKKGENLNVDFLNEFLVEYGFERVDFVYEAGEFAIRGGIVDVFSYANDLPYRIELFGNEVESIRTFDPISQLSEENKEWITIVPNVQTKLLQEVRESFLKYIPQGTRVWVKDFKAAKETIADYFARASADFKKILEKCGGTQIIQNPEQLFETKESFNQGFENLLRIEFGDKFSSGKVNAVIEYMSKAQPAFQKDFKKLANELEKNHLNGIQNILCSEFPNQLQRIRMIFEEINHDAKFVDLPIALRAGFKDDILRLVCYTDHQIFERFHRYHLKKKFSKNKSLTLKELRTLSVGDYVTHADFGIARFGGMEKVVLEDKEQERIRLIFKDDELLYVTLHSLHKISKYSGKDGAIPSISKLGSSEWEQKKRKVKSRLKDIAQELIKLYAQRKLTRGFSFSKDSYLQAELESSFIYEDTPDQAKATADVKNDMEQPYPMDRLVCGDVGFGKTEVAIRAAFKAVCDNKQVAVLVPTTILAFQHFRTFKERLEKFPVTIEYISRFRTAKEIKEVLEKTKEGKVDILIGTHRITSKDVSFKNLGLLIIDEEQKFGVSVKERLKEMRINVHVLTLTATPIPRTLQFSLMGARDLSVIATPPPNRQPVTTRLYAFNDEIIRDAIHSELMRGGQVFFVHNRIDDLETIANRILRLVPDAKIALAHGQMDGDKLEKIMLGFIEGQYDVLVSTNIVESGLDIPNANTIIINHAHMFGLSDLHQMRGRVGRSNRKAFCYLLVPSMASIAGDSKKRLSALEEFSDLGDGFKVAMKDLDIRGAGNLLGAEQSGFINDLGFDMYNKILAEAIEELKENEFKDLFNKETEKYLQKIKVDCTIETDLEILIPENYVSNISERLNLYIEADGLKKEEELTKFRSMLEDRFGKLPSSVEALLQTVRLRWKAEILGIEKLILKTGSMKIYLPESTNQEFYQSDVFGKILACVQKNNKRFKMKEFQKRIIIQVEKVETVEEAMKVLEMMK
ncbi:MAG: transcription-repair coupling factor [Flammeovirgaceae bacterium]